MSLLMGYEAEVVLIDDRGRRLFIEDAIDVPGGHMAPVVVNFERVLAAMNASGFKQSTRGPGWRLEDPS